ncbi:MAG: hypothetical protein IT169_06005 [Bryobacterales bacterium]|nr:hypothetical protein [Bryobacterales bacterium]
MERRDFFRSAAGIGTGLAAASSAGGAATTKGRPQRGVSLYSYQQLLGSCMTLEDALADIHDMGCTCFEALLKDIEGYPFPSTKWIDHFHGLCAKYSLRPADLANWCDTNVRRGPKMPDDMIVANMVRDIKLAHTLGFNAIRFRVTPITMECEPEPGWKSYVERLMPWAEKFDVKLQPEIHAPGTLTLPYIDEYIAFAAKHKGWGINADFGIFQNAWPEGVMPQMPAPAKSAASNASAPAGAPPPGGPAGRPSGPSGSMNWTNRQLSKPEDIIRILPYSRTCHAKFHHVDENFNEVTIPYKEILTAMVDHGWNGDLVSEYEGPKRTDRAHVSDQLRRQHLMMKRILGY